MKKRGISGIVTTILIILLVLAAIIIVWNVVKKTVRESSEKVGTEQFNIDLKASKLNGFSDEPIQISVTRNPGKGNLSSLKIIFKNSEGNTESISKTDCLPGELETKICEITQAELDGFVPVSYEVYPVIKTSSGKEVIGFKAYSSDSSKSEEIPEEPETCVNDEDWTNIGCGEGICSLGQMHQTCETQERCVANITCELINTSISYWKFEDNALDEKGLNDGTEHGNYVYVAGRNGKDKAIDFDGNGAYVQTSTSSNLNLNGKDVSFTVWGKFREFDWDSIYSYGSGGGWYTFYVTSDKTLHMRIDSTFLLSGDTILSENQWYFLAGVYDNSIGTITLYVDGNLDGPSESSKHWGSAISNTFARIGEHSTRTPPYQNMHGALDELMVFDKALTQEEIQSIYDLQS